MISSKHPSVEELVAFSGGRLSIIDAEVVEGHIGQCDPCCQTLLGLSSEDTFVGLLREAKHYEEFPTVNLIEAGPSTNTIKSQSIHQSLAAHPRYKIIDLIAKGGMGDVYKTEHRTMGRIVALKVINNRLIRNPEVVERFQREVRTAARLSHPNIVAAYDADQADGNHFLVMEFVDGLNLSALVKQNGPVTIANACNYAIQIAIGLQYAHEQGVVHRDIKPHNLMLTPSGIVKILDFGLATLVESKIEQEAKGQPDNSSLTATGSIMGTPDFISPEQAVDAHRADIRSDIYSLGATLYFMLSGQPPFSTGGTAERLNSHANAEPSPLRNFRPDLPQQISDIISRMMAKNPDERFQTPQEIAVALSPFVSDTSSEKASAPQPVTKVRRSWWPPNRLAIAAVSAMGFVFALGTIVYVETDKGTLVIESVDDSVKVYISQETDQAGNSQIKTRVVDTVTGSEIKTLPSGEYKIELGKDGNEFELSQGGFQLRRGGKEVVRVSRKEVVDNSDSDLEKQKATKPLMTLPRNVQQALSMKGNEISDDEVKQLEEKINLDANDFESRIVLMSYYYRKSILDKNFREPHLQQVYWFIENYPESDTAGSHSARIDAIMNPQGFVKGMDLWEKAMKANSSSVPVLVNASKYFMFSDKAKSEALLKQAQEMEPNNIDLMTKLAQLYSFSVISERTKDGRREASKKSLELFEKALLLESDSPNRTNLVVSAAKTAFDAGEFEKAKQFAEQLLTLDDKGDALHMGNTVLGRLAIQKGDLDSACNYLLESGKTAGSPVLGSFGPTMILAKELLVKGKKDAVLEYFELCSAFWKLDRGQLDNWSAIVKKGRIPDFGANLQR